MNYVPILSLIVSIIGFGDAAYLVAHHYLSTPLPCTIFQGCDVVTRSPYSTIGPISVALLGALYYLALCILLVAYIDTKKTSLALLAARLTPLGFCASLWFIFVQAVLLKAWCLYCIVSATTSTLLFVLGMITLLFHSSSKKGSQ
ncbi:hypothetical protein HY620_03115 [Candidatus Uhrbacteria bacterium]|nr:hypothetical protein [Candidatus Uhrbacteria bacterium]